jgi:hypothetical protein
MSFEFEPQENFNRSQLSNTSSSGSAMVDFLIRQGLVKDAASANMILVIFAILGLALSAYFFVYGFNLPQGDVAPTSIQEPIVSEEVEF